MTTHVRVSRSGQLSRGVERSHRSHSWVRSRLSLSALAWRNLLTRPARTILSLVGLSIPILGILGLSSLSAGIRSLMGDTLSQVQGVMVLRENVPSPVFSDLPAEIASTLRRIPGVRVVA